MSNISDFEVEVLQLINQHRQQLDLASLSFHAPIQEASRQHSLNMAEGTVPFGHDGFSERANQLIQLLSIAWIVSLLYLMQLHRQLNFQLIGQVSLLYRCKNQ